MPGILTKGDRLLFALLLVVKGNSKTKPQHLITMLRL